jgi:hypothetical protein
VTEITFEPDEIGPWSEIKLEIIEKYGPAYTQAFSGKGRALKKFYIDGNSAVPVFIFPRARKPRLQAVPRALSR